MEMVIIGWFDGTKDKKGTKWTPLMVAAIEGHLNLCRILLEHGALMELPGKVKSTNSKLPIADVVVTFRLVPHHWY